MTVKVNSMWQEPYGARIGVDDVELSCSETGDFLVAQVSYTSDTYFYVQCAV